MQKKIILIAAILGMFSLGSQASGLSYEEASMGRPSLLRSFVKEDPRLSALNELESSASGFMQPLHKHSTMYLCRNVAPVNPAVMKLIEKCLVTYCLLTIEEKGYEMDQEVLSLLEERENYPLSRLSEYQRLIRFSRNMNSVLPSRETTVLCHVRRPFSYFWPEIDLYDDMLKIHEHCPLTASYLEYLFKVNETEESITRITEDLHAAASKNLKAPELISLFCMHTFGHGGQRDMDLAKKEAAFLMKKMNLAWPKLFYKLMKGFGSSFQAQSPRVPELVNRHGHADTFSLCLSDPEAEEIFFDQDPESDDFSVGVRLH